MYVFKSSLSRNEIEAASDLLTENRVFGVKGMNLSHAVIHEGKVVGAMSSGWVKSVIGDYPFIEYQYSIAVDKCHRRKGICKQMMKIAIEEYNAMKDEVGKKTGLSVISSAWIVNPFVEKEIVKLGYSKISEFGKNLKHYILQ